MFNWNIPTAAKFFVKNSDVLVQGFYNRIFRSKPFAFSFNISERCPIGCHCYWRAQGTEPEMSDEDIVKFFQQKRHEGHVLANIVGGEPYVRPRLLEKVAGIIPFAWLVTSGTTPLLRLRQTTHVISIDGATAETHDRVRRSKGLFGRIVRNTERVRAKGDFPMIIHTTLNAMNIGEIEGILQFWQSRADGIIFSLMTPIRGADDEQYRPSYEQRVQAVAQLLYHKGEMQYRRFILSSNQMLVRLHPDETAKLHPGNCPTAQYIPSYRGSGKQIGQCILSERADCTQCGCVVTTMSGRTDEDSNSRTMGETMRLFWKMSTLK